MNSSMNTRPDDRDMLELVVDSSLDILFFYGFLLPGFYVHHPILNTTD